MTNGNTSTHGKTRKYSRPSTSLPKFQAKTHLKHLSKLDKVNTLTLWTGNNNTKKKKKFGTLKTRNGMITTPFDEELTNSTQKI